MMNMSQRSKVALSLWLITLPGTAVAYVDPGSGLMLLQGLIAIVGAVVIAVRNPVAALKRLIAKIRRK
jgi:hypothetical protein